MLSLSDIQKRLSEFKYFPGWELSAYEGAFEGNKLLIEADVDDYTCADEQQIHLHIVRPIDNLFETVNQFDIWLLKTLNRIAIHESMEALRINGKPVIDPHRDGSDRDLMPTDDCAISSKNANK